MRQQGKRNAPKEIRIPKVEGQSSRGQIAFWKNNKLAAFILFIFPFILYGYSITFGYVLDDAVVLSENKFVKIGFAGISDILSTESFVGYWGDKMSMVEGARYRPLSLVTFAIEYQFAGPNPKVSHFNNVLLYALTGISLLWILSVLFPLREGKKWYLSIPFAASLLFIAHPVHSEVVANIKGRDEILSLLFALISLAATCRFVLSGDKFLLAVSSVTFLLALLAKENAITFLAVIPLTVYFFQRSTFKQILISMLPLAAIAVVYIIIRHQIIGYLLNSGTEITGLMNNPFLYATGEQKYATIFYTLGLYVKLLFFPHPLTHDYYPYQIPLVNWNDLRAIIPLLFYLGMIAYSLIFLKKKTIASYCILYFIITLSIASNIVFNIGTFMNERFLYMPSIGFCILTAHWFMEIIPSWIKNTSLRKASAMAIPLLVITAFSAKTMLRVPDWKDILTLDRAAVKVSTNSARINSFYGYDLYKEAQKVQGDEQMKLVNEALPYIERALKIYPKYPDALTAKAGLLAMRYQNDRDLNNLLDGFYVVQMTSTVPFVDEYLDYLERGDGKSKLIPFYQKLGTALKKAGNIQKGEYYLKKAQ